MAVIDRRSFMKAGAVAAAGLTLPRRVTAQSGGSHELAYRTLGSTGYQVTELGFGAMNTRDSELIRAAVDSGINYVDTAHGYMKGVNEEIVGKALKGVRDKVFLVTKVYWKDKTPKELRSMMELSLKRLQMDYVDTMFLHITNKREQILNEDYIKTFDQARKDGLCRFVGVTTHAGQTEVLDAAVESKFWESVLVGYNYTSPPTVTLAIERARNSGLAIIGMKTQLKGTGFPNHRMGDITVNQAALKWVLDNPYVDTTIPGMTSFEQLEEDLSVMGMKMSFHEHRTLERYGMSIQQGYCRGVAGCTECQGQCPYGVDVCEINRCLGYASGYGDIALAQENYERLPESSRLDICDNCDECVVRCANGIDLTENIRRARTLFS